MNNEIFDGMVVFSPGLVGASGDLGIVDIVGRVILEYGENISGETRGVKIRGVRIRGDLNARGDKARGGHVNLAFKAARMGWENMKSGL